VTFEVLDELPWTDVPHLASEGAAAALGHGGWSGRSGSNRQHSAWEAASDQTISTRVPTIRAVFTVGIVNELAVLSERKRPMDCASPRNAHEREFNEFDGYSMGA
jgi:hypothetical protein